MADAKACQDQGYLNLFLLLMKDFKMNFWAKILDVNCPKDGTICSTEIISLVAFHLQTRHPPILPDLVLTFIFQFMFIALLWLHRGLWGT